MERSLAAGLFCLALAACSAADGSAAAPVATKAFVALSCNIRYGTADDGANAWPERRDLLAATITAERPDILGVQEALSFQLDFLAQALPNHQRLGQGRDGGERGEHAALFVDTRRFAIVDHGDFWLSPTPDVPASTGWDAALTRICTWARLCDRTDGAPLLVFCTHFDHRGKTARLESARLLAQHVRAADSPVLVLGDLNAGEGSPPLAALHDAGLRDTFRDCQPDAREVGTFHAFRGGIAGDKIDYVLAGPGLATVAATIVVAAGPGERQPSDHHFVAATLQRPPRALRRP